LTGSCTDGAVAGAYCAGSCAALVGVCAVLVGTLVGRDGSSRFHTIRLTSGTCDNGERDAEYSARSGNSVSV